jgi:hypothetical protein
MAGDKAMRVAMSVEERYDMRALLIVREATVGDSAGFRSHVFVKIKVDTSSGASGEMRLAISDEIAEGMARELRHYVEAHKGIIMP